MRVSAERRPWCVSELPPQRPPTSTTGEGDGVFLSAALRGVGWPAGVVALCSTGSGSLRLVAASPWVRGPPSGWEIGQSGQVGDCYQPGLEVGCAEPSHTAVSNWKVNWKIQSVVSPGKASGAHLVVTGSSAVRLATQNARCQSSHVGCFPRARPELGSATLSNATPPIQ